MKISIILPVYNKEKYIAHTLQDIAEQRFSDFECIVVDDGSTDRSGEICDKVSLKDSRFRVFHISNGGVSHARNYGMDQAKGELLTFIDGDDRIEEYFLESLYHCYCVSGSNLVIGNFFRIWEDGRKQNGRPFPYDGLRTIEDILPEFVTVQRETGVYGYCVAKLFPRELARGLSFDESIKLAEDYDFYLKLYERVHTIYFDNKCYYGYLQQADNSSWCVDDYKTDYISQLMIHLRAREFLKKQNAFYGENQKTLNEVVENYLYFSLFYVNIEDFFKTYHKLKAIVREYGLKSATSGEKRQQRWMRYFWSNRPTMILCNLVCYRAARWLLRR